MPPQVNRATEHTPACRWTKVTRSIRSRLMRWPNWPGRCICGPTPLANVYGPRQNPYGAAGVIAVLGSAMITGRPFAAYRDGAAAHDYVYVDDVVDAFVRAGCSPMETTGTYNIGTGQHTTVTEVHGLISAVLDGSSPSSFAAARSDEWHAIALNATKAEKELGWKPTVDLAEGIQRTIRWMCATLEPEPAALVNA